MKRVLVVNNIPAPYFDPVFAKLGEEPGWSLRVCYTSNWNENAGWVEKPVARTSYEIIILDRQKPALTRWLGRSLAAAIALLAELRRRRPDYVVSYGYTLLPQFVALIWSAATSTSFAVVGDANVYVDKATGVKRAIKGAWLHWVVKRAAALIAIGTANRKFWQKYGAMDSQLFEARYAVDNDHFERAAAAERGRSSEISERLGPGARVIFLFVGRLVARKNVALLIEAVRRLPDADIRLLIVGDGDQRLTLEDLAARDPRIVFAGGASQSELPRYYAIADVLVLPARDEPWGLVINEAMASHLAVIAHKHCGAAVDLVDSDNGVALQTFDIAELTEALARLANDDEVLRKLQDRSRQKISSWSIDDAARGIISAVNQQPRRPLGQTAIGEVE